MFTCETLGYNYWVESVYYYVKIYETVFKQSF